MDLEKIMYGAAIFSTIALVIIIATDNTDLIENESWMIEETCLGSHSSDISHIHSNLAIFIDGLKFLDLGF